MLCFACSSLAWTAPNLAKDPSEKKLQQLLSSLDQIRTRNQIAALGVAAPKALIPASLTEAQQAKLLGSYRAVTTRFAGSRLDKLQIIEVAGKLFTRINGKNTAQLIAVATSLFIRKKENQATIAIIEDTDGKMYYQGSLGNFVKTSAVSNY